MFHFLSSIKRLVLKARLFRLHPFGIFVLSLAATVLLLHSSFNITKSPLPGTNFLLSHSQSFARIVSCTETSEGLACFRKFRPELKQEIANQFSPYTLERLENCFDVVSKNANEIALLLNIQTCFYQADTLERSNILNVSNSFNWKNLCGLFVSLLFQLVVCWQTLVILIDRTKESNVVDQDLQLLRQDIELSNRELQESFKTLFSFYSRVRDECGGLADKVSSGEVSNMKMFTNIDKSMEELRYSMVSIKEALSNFPNSQTLSSLSESPLLQLNSSLTEPEIFTKNHFHQPFPTCYMDQNIPIASDKPQDEVKERVETSIKASLNGKVFDLKTPEGKREWHNFIKQNKSTRRVLSSLENVAFPSNIASSKQKQEIEDEKTAIITKEELDKLPKYDKNGKPFRRLFVPGHGWVSSKKLNNIAGSKKVEPKIF